MHYELWDNDSGNFIMAAQTEQDAHRNVRRLIEDGWSADDISLTLAPDTPDEIGKYPPAIGGDELLARVFGSSGKPSTKAARLTLFN
jgi:hypothetical protein